jgi:hypothetical protein
VPEDHGGHECVQLQPPDVELPVGQLREDVAVSSDRRGQQEREAHETVSQSGRNDFGHRPPVRRQRRQGDESGWLRPLDGARNAHQRDALQNALREQSLEVVGIGQLLLKLVVLGDVVRAAQVQVERVHAELLLQGLQLLLNPQSGVVPRDVQNTGTQNIFEPRKF